MRRHRCRPGARSPVPARSSARRPSSRWRRASADRGPGTRKHASENRSSRPSPPRAAWYPFARGPVARRLILRHSTWLFASTMDPLEARNASFNFAKLGAYTREYHRDFYGAMPDKLNKDLPSDRIYIEWPIGHDRTYKRLKGEDRAPSLEAAEGEGVRYVLRADGERPGKVAFAEESHLLVEIPPRFQDIKSKDPALALACRLAARDAFEAAFSRGYAPVEFLRSGDGRGAYLLVPQPRRDEPIDTDDV